MRTIRVWQSVLLAAFLLVGGQYSVAENSARGSIPLVREDSLSALRAGADFVVQAEPKALLLKATFHPNHYQAAKAMEGHHAIVWQGGRASHKALFTTITPDRKVAEALRNLGLTAGDNLTLDTWYERDNPANPDPDRSVEGSPLVVHVRFEGSDDFIPLKDLLHTPDDEGLDLRFAGNEGFIKDFRSGCIVCLHSCPGGKIGNAKRTLRQYEQGRAKFSLRKPFSAKKFADAVIVVTPR